MKAKKKYTSGGKMTKEAMMKYMMGGKMPKAQNGAAVELDQVVVKDKKGAGVKPSTVVARGKSGEDFTAKRKELVAAEMAKLQKGKAPGYKPTERERSDAMDNVRKELAKQGYSEQGVIRKDTKTRLSAEDEAYAKERMGRGR